MRSEPRTVKKDLPIKPALPKVRGVKGWHLSHNSLTAETEEEMLEKTSGEKSLCMAHTKDEIDAAKEG